MLRFLKRTANVRVHAIRNCTRVYAIGDVHGRRDLFEEMMRKIGEDLQIRPTQNFRIVFLGDLIDRGPDSAKIISRLIDIQSFSKKLLFLKGNHEELFLCALDGNEKAADFFYKLGGRETLASYGLDPQAGDEMEPAEITCWMQENIPLSHAEFIDSFADMYKFEGHILVHAGLRPLVKLKKQRVADLRWIRNDFLEFDGAFPGIVVHGHSISHDVDAFANRIGVDTGAYRSGLLTAIAIEQREKWLIQVQGSPGSGF